MRGETSRRSPTLSQPFLEGTVIWTILQETAKLRYMPREFNRPGWWQQGAAQIPATRLSPTGCCLRVI